MANILEQLRSIEVQPNLEWKNQTRSFLMSEVGRYGAANSDLAASADHFKLMNFAWRPVAIMAVVVIFVLGGTSFTALATRKAMPGDRLFVVKRAWEKINEYMVTDAARKTELASAILETRVDDLQRVLDQETVLVSAGSDGERGKSIFVAVDEVKKQIEEVNDKFVSMQDEEKESGKRMVEAALALNERIRSYKQEIRSVKEQVESVEADKELDVVLNRVEDINSSVLALIVDKHSTGEVKLEEDDLAQRVGDHVKQVEDKLAQVVEAAETVPEKDNADLIKQKVDEAKIVMQKANEALTKNEYHLALTLSDDSNKILELLYGSIYQVNNDEKEQSGEVKGAETVPTTTETIIPKIIAPSATTTKAENQEQKPETYEVNILR